MLDLLFNARLSLRLRLNLACLLQFGRRKLQVQAIGAKGQVAVPLSAQTLHKKMLSYAYYDCHKSISPSLLQNNPYPAVQNT